MRLIERCSERDTHDLEIDAERRTRETYDICAVLIAPLCPYIISSVISRVLGDGGFADYSSTAIHTGLGPLYTYNSRVHVWAAADFTFDAIQSRHESRHLAVFSHSFSCSLLRSHSRQPPSAPSAPSASHELIAQKSRMSCRKA